jgi:murein DD-endopeptidase MepM/ murein hydrolase activator NlpD
MKLEEILKKHQQNFSGLFPFSLKEKKIFQLDLSVNNEALNTFDLFSIEELQAYIDRELVENKSEVAIGGYAEDRMVYRKSTHFGEGENARSIHLGVDIWLEANTAIQAPLDARVHSFQNNNNFGDYGPTILLEHELDGEVFYTLYGHLTRSSIKTLEEGQIIKKGKVFTAVGNKDENGKWPPHLHFQLIREMGNQKGDFPGVASKKEKNKMLGICPDPNLILNLY